MEPYVGIQLVKFPVPLNFRIEVEDHEHYVELKYTGKNILGGLNGLKEEVEGAISSYENANWEQMIKDAAELEENK